MRATHWRRITAASAGAALGLVVLGAVPAFADDLSVSAPFDLTVATAPAGGTGQVRTLEVGLSHWDTGDAVGAGSVTVDASGLAGVADVVWPAACTPAPDGTSAVCVTGDVPTVHTAPVDLGLRAVPGAAAGATGTVLFSATAGDLSAPDAAETDVTLGDGPDLAVSQAAQQDHVEPGSALDLPLTLTNQGNRTVGGTLLWMFASHGLGFATRHDNCSYLDEDAVAHPTGTEAVCVLDHPVAPGDVYDLPAAGLEAGPQALYDRFDYSVEPYSADALAGTEAGRTFVPGTGPALALVPVTTGDTTAPTASASDDDLNSFDNGRTVSVTADNSADIAVSADPISGSVGDVVTEGVTVTDRGPGWVSSLFAGDPVVTVDVTFPAGVAVTTVPPNCTSSGAGYRCHTPIYLWEDQHVTFDFGVRVDAVEPGAAGTVSTLNDLPEVPLSAYDHDLSDNTAPITLAP